jgi:hypothetical protein
MIRLDGLLAPSECVRKVGDGRYMARCPSHADRVASLSISIGRDGRYLLHDFAGCAMTGVLATACPSLSWADLMPADRPSRR